MNEQIFLDEIKRNNITDPFEILNWYRNLYYKEASGTERQIVAMAIDKLLGSCKERIRVVNK